MANFIVSYDLNGPTPSHKQFDELLEKMGAARARILETVWYVGVQSTAIELYNSLNSLLSRNDQIIVVEAKDAAWRNLLVSDAALAEAWERNRS